MKMDESGLGMKLVLDESGIGMKVVLDEIFTFRMKVVLDELVFYPEITMVKTPSRALCDLRKLVVPGVDGVKVCFHLQWFILLAFELRWLRQRYCIDKTRSSRSVGLQSAHASSQLIMFSSSSGIVLLQRRDTCHQRFKHPAELVSLRPSLQFSAPAPYPRLFWSFLLKLDGFFGVLFSCSRSRPLA